MENVIFFLSFLVKLTSASIFCEENQRAYGLFGSLGLDNLTVQALGFSIIILVLAYNLLGLKQNESVRTEIEPSSNKDDSQDPGPKLVETIADPEYPNRYTKDHAVFEKTGVEVLASRNSSRPTGKQVRVPCDLALQTLYASESAEPDLLQEDELLLSPILTLMSSTRLNELLELRIPHSANMVLSCKNWTVILKEKLNSAKWASVAETGKKEAQGVKNFVTNSNHVRFDTDHLSTFAIVGKYHKSSLSVLKRMKLAAFSTDAKVGEDVSIRIYCFDDCEWSLERIMAREQKEGGKMVSSIESLNFSVTLENDVEITVKDVADWQLNQDSTKVSDLTVSKLSHTSLKSSFNLIPYCELVFHPTNNTDNNGFFVAMTFAQQSSEKTVLYASVTIKKR
ncbi:Netrin receptor unc5c [Porites harrisoni]